MQKKILYLIVIVIIAVVAALLIYFSSTGSSASTGLAAYDNKVVPSSILSQLNVPNNVSNKVNATLAAKQQIISNISDTNVNASPLYTSSGKPIILYIGAEYCPYCAAERWAMVVALQRFGTFTNLRYMTSSSSDIFASTPTFTFYNSTYSSSYIAFIPVELTTNVKNGPNSYTPLQYPNASQNATLEKLNPGGSIPFIDIANRSVQVGASFNPGVVLAGYNWTSAASAANNPQTIQSKAIVGTANLFTAQICEATSNMPSSVCDQPYVTALEKS